MLPTDTDKPAIVNLATRHADRASQDARSAKAKAKVTYSRSMIVTLAVPPPSHIVCRP
jgi:hypothetical protein